MTTLTIEIPSGAPGSATALTIEIPADAYMPVGAPAIWLAAADRAGWQCQCVTPETGKPPCGRSHRHYEGARCHRRAAGPVAVRLVLVPDGAGSYWLMCETCAGGHNRAAARRRAAIAAKRPMPDTLF